MAPSHKRKADLDDDDDDFIRTISDNDADIPDEEEEVLEDIPANKKTNNNKKKTKTSGGKKKSKQQQQASANEDGDCAEDDGLTGIWGQKDEDDGAMDSEFEFALENGADGVVDEEFAGWGFEGAKKGVSSENRKVGVDLDEIIRRRRERKEGKGKGMAKGKGGKDEGEEEEGEEEEEEVDGDMDIDLDLEDDREGLLAEDGFGMGVGSDVEEEDGDGDEEMVDRDEDEDEGGGEGNGEEEGDDDDSVATPVEHPDDVEESEDEEDEEEDAEEAAKRKDFFAAPDEFQKPGKKGQLSTFQGMSLSRPILRGLTSVGFTKPTPIQEKTIPIALMGKDVVGGAVTGSGKTAAFVVPILERLLYRPKKVPTTRVVILTPTRELAIQCHAVATKLASHTDIKFCLAVGGLSLKVQEAELRLRPDVVIATPGRFIDHMRNSASFAVETVEILVLDEADRMLEDGFADELNEILTTLPKSRQTMLFSATMTSSVDKLIRVGLNKPARIMVDSQKKTAGTLTQEFVRLRPGREEKRMGYLVHICKTLYTERVIVFFRQKKVAHRTRIIFGLLGMSCAELHGSMNQAQRIASVEAFRDGKVKYLLATDLASRGLDIKGIDTVINYEAPQTLDIYVHRVGRTARAGRSGVAITLAAEPDRKVVKAAVKAGKAQGSKIISRVIEPAEADKWQARVDEMEDEIEEIMQEEKEEKQLAQMEMQVKKGENLIKHEEEIHSRPKRTWFETEKDKKKAKEAGRAELNGVREQMKKKGAGKLSNKDKKKLDSKAERSEGKSWKKGRAERSGKGAVLNLKKVRKPKPKGPAGRKGFKGKKFKPATTTTLAPFKRLLRSSPLPRPLQQHPHLHPHPHHRPSLLRYLFPRTVRDLYRERLLRFRLETLPRYKHRLQSRIYRFIVERQRKRREQTRLVDLVRSHGRRLLLGTSGTGKAALGRVAKGNAGVTAAVKAKDSSSSSTLSVATDRGAGAGARRKMQRGEEESAYGYGATRYGYGYGYGSGGSESPPLPGGRERGARRKRLAAMAGSVYRAGVAAATELKEQYNNTRTRGAVLDMSDAQFSIPGAFPQVSIVTKGEEQMVLFPTYAKRHVREFGNPGRFPPGQHSFHAANAAQMGVSEEQYWKQEWARVEDEKAVADVDVRGWIYMPSKGPMTRRNRMLIGLARRLSGIPTPNTQPGPEFSPHEDHQKMKEEQRIAREAREIERRGQGEEEVAERGGYSEFPSGPEAAAGFDPVGKTHAPVSPPPSPTLSARTPTMQQQSDLTDAELAVANANLMARIGPFMTTPLVQIPVTMFFYNDEQSRSHTVMTDDSGHFITRIALEFVPTHVRVLANEDLSATKPIEIIEDRGVSLISDIDDTVKRSNISLGAREIFRNTFVRELADLTIEGVREWYGRMHDLGVKIHYCSNSPWQLFPVLATFFHTAGLPHGSIHLKQYSGMLQGIFEPVAERKKGTLEAILRDFPERKFLLVGDSGEADLEVYTELVVANPGRILAVFIRDVTTPDQAGFFDSSFTMGTPRSNTVSSRTKPEDQSTRDEPKSKPQLPPRAPAPPPASTGPIMGTLIDFSDEPAQISPGEMPANEVKPENPVRKAPPPRPAKPAALRSASSDASSGSQKQRPSPALNPRLEDLSMADDSLRPLQRAQTQSSVASSNSARPAPPPPPPPRRGGTPLLAQQQQQSRGDSNPNPDVTEMDASLPPASGSSGSFPVQAAAAASAMSETAAGAASYGPAGTAAVNKKVDLWLRRLARAHEILDAHGVKLYTWRRGDEVTAEAEGIVREALGRIEVDGRERGDRKGL